MVAEKDIEEGIRACDRVGGISDPAAVRRALSLLAALFSLRIVLQALHSLADVAVIPGPAYWDSGTLPYDWLLVCQLAILLGLILLIRAVDGRPRPGWGLALSLLGGLYLAAMLARAVVGVVGLLEAPWFAFPLPTAFHLVLAAFCLVLGLHWRAAGRTEVGLGRLARLARPALYPMILGGALTLFAWSSDLGIAAPFAAYLAALLGAAAVMIAEQLLPYRHDWQAKGRDLRTDALYLLFVQLALTGLMTAAVVWIAETGSLSAVDLWPHNWPIALQVLVMLVAADFLRYWLHRACHRYPLLWRLHAVHHAPLGLHASSVVRFHPFEKVMQLAFDSLPFLLLGVGGEVMAAYLVFYAVNGFFQHANLDVRLGWLNWVISGPELHRWHHAKAPRISDHNFGNNLIVWDLIFGTRLLPKDREVGVLGLRNPNYPQGFFGQALAPFAVNPNKGDPR